MQTCVAYSVHVSVHVSSTLILRTQQHCHCYILFQKMGYQKLLVNLQKLGRSPLPPYIGKNNPVKKMSAYPSYIVNDTFFNMLLKCSVPVSIQHKLDWFSSLHPATLQLLHFLASVPHFFSISIQHKFNCFSSFHSSWLSLLESHNSINFLIWLYVLT